MGVQLDAGLNHWPAQFGAHMSARFSDGRILAMWFDGLVDSNGSLVYRTSADGGATWAAKVSAVPMSENAGSFQAHFDLAQVGDVLYGACIRYVAGVQVTPFRLVYNPVDHSITVTVGGNTAIASYTSAGGNPTQGGTQLTVSHDGDHSLLHVGVQLPGGLALYAVSESTLAIAYSKTAGGPATANFNQPVVYCRGTVWAFYDTSVASVSASGSAYGTWSGATALPGGTGAPTHGCSAALDTTQSPSQPMFASADLNGILAVYTFDGVTWTRTAVDSSGNDFGADLWVVSSAEVRLAYNNFGIQVRRRIGGVWGAPTLVDASGDRAGWPTSPAPFNGTVALVYFTAGPFSVFAQSYTFAGTAGTLTASDAPAYSLTASDAQAA